MANGGGRGLGKRGGAWGLACRKKVSLSPAGLAGPWRERDGLSLVGRAWPNPAGRGGAGCRRARSGRWRCVCCGTRFAERRRCPGCEFRFPVPAVAKAVARVVPGACMCTLA